MDELADLGWSNPVWQVNLSYTACAGTIRGMHYQDPPFSENKLVSCIRGKVWDVAIDLRADSSTFLNWHAEFLSADNLSAMYIPKGFAHGFQSITTDVELIYCHSEKYSFDCEKRVNPFDPKVRILWPLNCTAISSKDLGEKYIDEQFKGLML